MKQLFLAFLGVIIFVVSVGFMGQKLQGKSASGGNFILGKETKKEIIVGGIKIEAKIASTDAQREKGLGGQIMLAKNEGMLFVFEQKKVYPTFWMKGMLIPIDIIWIKDSKIAKIDKNIPAPKTGTADKDLVLYYPDNPIDYVLEVAAGFSDKNNLQVGDSVKIDQ